MKKSKFKKAAAVGLCCTIISTSTVFAVTNNISINNDIKMQINNEWVEIHHSFIENNRTMIPLDSILNEFGLKVENDLNSNTVKIYHNNFTIILSTENSTARVLKNINGVLTENNFDLDVSPKIIDNKIFVPIRFVAETMGAKVNWDNTLRAVIIDTFDEITVEKPIEFETVNKESIANNAILKKLYDENYMTKGIYSFADGEWIYVLVSAGEKTTGGYGLSVDSITEVTIGTAYIHATLTSPAEGSIVTQVLTYPNVMVKFNKGDIIEIQWDLSGDADVTDTDELELTNIENLVKSFGKSLKMVSLLAPEDIVKDAIKENYGEFISSTLLEKWQNDPVNAPGRVSSSPWPERIDIHSIEKITDTEYTVNGYIIEMTSVEMVNGGIAAKRPITLNIKKVDERWLIDKVSTGDYINDNSTIYENKEYGFKFSLPESWENYSIVTNKWEGLSLTDSKENQSGELLYIRHPEWTEENPRQDIPVMIFTQEQWNSLNNGEYSVGAAPVLPSKLGENSLYVFALPARYNYSFLTGYEEVEKILEESPLHTFEVK